MKIMQENLTVQKFINMVSEGELSLEHPLQREAGKWGLQKRQGFIESIINGLYIPPFFVVEKGDSYLLDGLQRYTTIKQVVNDEFIFISDVRLHKNGTVYSLAGKKFSEIDKKLQDKILQFNFTFAHVTEATNKEIELMFYNINNQEQMSESTKAKSILGIDTAKWLNTIIKNKFFTDNANLTDSQRKKTDEQLILFQYMYLSNVGSSIDSIAEYEIMAYLRENKEVFTKEVRKEIESICEYISSSLPENNDKYKKITKTHIPMLMMTAKTAIASNINAKIFGEWIYQFFKDYASSDYKNKGCGSGNVKKDKTLFRIDAMKKHYNKYINDTKKQVELTAGEEEQTATQEQIITVEINNTTIATQEKLTKNRPDYLKQENSKVEDWEYTSDIIPNNVMAAFSHTT